MNELKGLRDYHLESDLTVQSHSRKYLPKIVNKFSDLKSVDKLYAAQENVNQIQNVMAENIKKTVQNQQRLEVTTNPHQYVTYRILNINQVSSRILQKISLPIQMN